MFAFMRGALSCCCKACAVRFTFGGVKADTELGEEGRLARVKATASVILNEYLMCESSVDAAHLIEDLSAPRCSILAIDVASTACRNALTREGRLGRDTTYTQTAHAARQPPLHTLGY